MNSNEEDDGGGGVKTRGSLRGLMWCGGTGCLVALFLAGLVGYMEWFEATATVPFCGWGLDWLDCETVLMDGKWSVWMGVPVAWLGVLVYLFGVMGPVLVLRKGGEVWVRRAWLTLYGSGVVIVLSAVWFVGLQVFVIGKLCWFCMVEHGIGLCVGVMIWRSGRDVFRELGGACYWPRMVGIFLVGVMVGGQMTSERVRSHRVEGLGGGYVEMGIEGAVVIGDVVLNRDEHPMVGAVDALRVVVKVLDYTCPRCKGVNEKWRVIESSLPDAAILVIHWPLSDGCNRFMEYTDERHEDACEITKLGKAVWVVDARKYGVYHDWLFENQDGLTLAMAVEKAGELVGAEGIEEVLASGTIEAMIERDVEIARALGVSSLPGIFAGGRVLDVVGVDEEELLRLLEEAFEVKVGVEP